VSSAPGVTVSASTEDIGVLASVLARAFADDPFVGWMVRKDEKPAALERYFAVNLRIALSRRATLTLPERSGAALWVPPNRWKMGLWQELALAPSLIGAFGFGHALDVARAVRIISLHHPHEPHWYLFVLGVDPPLQGRGLGSMLMAPVLDRCDREGLPAYLETGLRRNIAFYERHGFRVVRELDILDAPPLWLMWREARNSATGPGGGNQPDSRQRNA
jgi:GNAT superfamily N-acetyltransferase